MTNKYFRIGKPKDTEKCFYCDVEINTDETCVIISKPTMLNSFTYNNWLLIHLDCIYLWVNELNDEIKKEVIKGLK